MRDIEDAFRSLQGTFGCSEDTFHFWLDVSLLDHLTSHAPGDQLSTIERFGPRLKLGTSVRIWPSEMTGFMYLRGFLEPQILGCSDVLITVVHGIRGFEGS